MAEEKKKKAQRPKALFVREAHSRNLITWTPALIRNAEVAADRGDLTYAANLCDSILTDDRVQGVMGALTSVITLPLTFDPDDTQAAKALEGKKGDWWRIFPDPELQELIRWGALLGVGLAYIAGWHRDEETGNMIPDIEVWHPRNLRWDANLDKWFVKVFGGGEEEVTPGDGQWILYTPYGKRRPWAKAPWRGLSDWWLLKKYAKHDWAGHSERLGNGTQVVTEKPAEQNALPVDEDEGAAERRRQELADSFKRLGRNATAILPAGFDYKLVESIARTFESFRAQVDCANTAIAIALVGQNLSTEVESGSLAAAEVHAKVEGRKIRDIAESISTMGHEQALPRYIELNYAGEVVPWPIYDTTPPEDVTAKTEAQKNFSEALKNLSDAGYEVEDESLEEASVKLGLKIVKKAKLPEGSTDSQ